MLDNLSTWLREQRLAHGWSVAEMGRQLQQAAKVTGDHTSPLTPIRPTNARRCDTGNLGLHDR